MFVAEGRYAEAEIRDQVEIEAIVRNLTCNGYKPLLRSMLDAACQVASLPASTLHVDALSRAHGAYRRPDLPPTSPGELFFREHQAFALQPMAQRLHVWEVRPHSVCSELTTFCQAVESAARTSLDSKRTEVMDFTWKVVSGRPLRRSPLRGRFYQEPTLETKPPAYSAEEAQAARLLVPAQTRSFILRLAQVGKARSVDAASEADSALTGPLLETGMVRREYLVLCRQDSHTICALQDKADLNSERGATFVCAICGRPFKDELVQEIFALTDQGKRLLSGSRWMTIWITELLIRAGIDRDQIAWNAVAGEDELDIMTDALGLRVFFELKDREFGLGDAYPFAYRVTRYGGAFGIVTSTDRVAEEAKKFFQEQRSSMEARIEALEGQEGIENGIHTLIDRVSRIGVTQVLLELTEPFGFDLVPVLQAWMEQLAGRPMTSNHGLQADGGNLAAL